VFERRVVGKARSFAVGLAIALLTLAAGAATASSAHAVKFVHEIVAEGAGTAEGQFGFFGSGAQDVAVNRRGIADGSVDPLGASTDGYVYVVDPTNNRIQVFDTGGDFRFTFGQGVLNGASVPQICTTDDTPCSAGAAGGLGGAFNRPQGVVIDQSSGNVFVSDRGNRRVQEFEADGSFVRAWGWDVVASGPDDDTTAPVNELETCIAANGDVCQAGSIGAGLGQFSSSSLVGGGIGFHAPSGDLLVADPGSGNRVQRFDVPVSATAPVTGVLAFGPFDGFAAGGLGSVHIAVDDAGIVYGPSSAAVLARYDLNGSAFIAPLDVPAVSGTDPGAATVGLEIDPVTGNLFSARDRAPSGGPRYSPVVELDDPGAVDPANVDLVNTHVVGTGFTWRGIGLDPDSPDGCMYLTGVSAGSARSLLRACDGPLPPPVTEFGLYSDVGSQSATVSFSIDTTGDLPVSYEVQLSNPDSLGSFVTMASGQVAGSPTPVDVSEAISGLRPGTAYQVRVVASKPFNNPSSFTVNPMNLVTQGQAPSVIDVDTDSIDDTSVRLTGRVNPNGEETSYRFEWGTESFDGSIPVPDGVAGDGFAFEQVSAQLTGLEPSTTYRFRLVATSSMGTTTRPAGGLEFTTAATVSETARGFELVSPSDKWGGQGVGFWPGGLGHLASSGLAAHVGDRFAAQSNFGSTLDGNGGFSHSNDWVFAERGDDATGWLSRSPLTHPNYAPRTGQPVELRAASPDLSSMYWMAPSSLAVFPEMSDGGPVGARPGWSNLAAGLMSDWGGPFGSPTRWELFGPRSKDHVVDQGFLSSSAELFQVMFSPDGSTALAQTHRRAGSSGLSEVFGLAGANDPTWPSPANPATPGVPAYGDLVSGRSIYLGDISDGLADNFAGTPDRELINVCSGEAGVDRTQVPSSDGTNFAALDCPAGIGGRDALVSRQGAALSPTTYARKGMVSENGSRAFFLSPDPLAGGVPNGTTSFCAGTGATSVCPPQLYVRQRNADGAVVTRWLSKPEPALLGQQAATLLGTARFEGASADGRRVYFRTNSPLTVDDPNGLSSPTSGGVKTGTVDPESWDLYMLELSDGPDPTGSGSTLTRISAGPNGDGDCNSPLPSSFDDNDTVGALRFLSEDGDRAYFTCQAPLPGVVASADEQRITSPGGTVTTADQTNLYFYDHNRSESQRWRFVARLPRSASARLAACASTGIERHSPFRGDTGTQPHIGGDENGANCVNGSQDGQFITLFTDGRLTVDDPGGTPADEPPGNPAADIYAYDGESDRLVRVTAPQGGGGGSYPCIGDFIGTPADESLTYSCHGDGGLDAQNGVTFKSSDGPTNLGVATDPESGERMAFFQSAGRLVSDDLDSGYDVYEWRDGKLSLVTSGAVDSEDALYKGNDVTGTNVYFVTREALTWQDTDVVADIYTARVGGGIDQPPPPPTCDVLPGRCQGPENAPLPIPSLRTKSPGSGNLSPGAANPVLSLSRPSSRALRQVVRSGVLRLGVRAGRAGMLRGTLRARLSPGGKLRTIASGRVRATGAGRVTLRLRLSKPALRRLRSGSRLAAAVRVSGLGAAPRSLKLGLPGRGEK